MDRSERFIITRHAKCGLWIIDIRTGRCDYLCGSVLASWRIWIRATWVAVLVSIYEEYCARLSVVAGLRRVGGDSVGCGVCGCCE